ncbi:MAG: hypothetical protein E6G58_10905 [Actinobacteria bacterium]|nr:MAG: hypothetical protein E6G58_10905 [Actinomycetota bacterium]
MSRAETTQRPGVHSFVVVVALLSAAPALWLRFATPDLSYAIEALLFGLAIVGAAFLLSWAAEVAQLDISAGLAIAVLALIAVLPEYAVDFVFAWQGGASVQGFGPACPSTDPGAASPCSLALANMTGANRLLIGLGWTSVVFIAWYRTRRAGRALPEGAPARPPVWSGVALDRTHSVELAFLAVATLYSLTLPLKSSITLIDGAVLLILFGPVLDPPDEGARGGAASDRSGPVDRVVRGGRAAGKYRRDGRLGGARDRPQRRALRPCRGPDRSRARDLGVLPGAVARAARLGGAGVHRGRSVRLAAPDGHRPRSPRQLEGEPVDLAGRVAPDRVRDLVGQPARVADRRNAGR